MRYTKKNIRVSTQINTTEFLREGESIESKLRKIVASQEPIDIEMTPEIYQERSAGVDPMCDIRTDKMALAQDACDSITRTHLLARANKNDMGTKKQEEFTYVTDSNGNIVKNPNLEQFNQERGKPLST